MAHNVRLAFLSRPESDGMSIHVCLFETFALHIFAVLKDAVHVLRSENCIVEGFYFTTSRNSVFGLKGVSHDDHKSKVVLGTLLYAINCTLQ